MADPKNDEPIDDLFVPRVGGVRRAKPSDLREMGFVPVAERDEAREWVRRITSEQRTLTCVYCGHAYPPGTPEHGAAVLTAHIEQCEKHPMHRLRKVVAAADAWRETLHLPQQDLGCLEFNNAFAVYDDARDQIADLIPLPPSDDADD